MWWVQVDHTHLPYQVGKTAQAQSSDAAHGYAKTLAWWSASLLMLRQQTAKEQASNFKDGSSKAVIILI